MVNEKLDNLVRIRQVGNERRDRGFANETSQSTKGTSISMISFSRRLSELPI